MPRTKKPKMSEQYNEDIIKNLRILEEYERIQKNPYKAVQLTLGNPNFAGAFVGIIAVVPIAFASRAQKLRTKLANLAILFLLIFVGIGTKSLQAILLLILSFFSTDYLF